MLFKVKDRAAQGVGVGGRFTSEIGFISMCSYLSSSPLFFPGYCFSLTTCVCILARPSRARRIITAESKQQQQESVEISPVILT